MPRVEGSDSVDDVTGGNVEWILELMQQASEQMVNLEVGQIIQRCLPYSLVILAELWPDWLLALNQSWAYLFVFCDCEYQTELKEKLEELLSAPIVWRAPEEFGDHQCHHHLSLAVLVTGSYQLQQHWWL
jgi:hypothetical protein